MGSAVRAGLGRVVVAPYLLTSQGIFVETEPGQVRAARQHQWAEPVDSGFRWFLRIEMGRALGHEVGGGLVDMTSWDYTIDVYIARLHGTMQGDAILEGGWVVRKRGEGAIAEYTFAERAPLAKEGYPALVDAQRGLLGNMADAMADSLRSAMEEPTSEPVP